MRLSWRVFLVLLLSCCWVRAQESQPQLEETGTQVASTPTKAENPEPTDENSGDSFGYLSAIETISNFEFGLSLAVLLFGLFVVVLEYKLLLRTEAGPTSIIRVLAVTLILVGSLFLITAGYSSSQISPVSGLFGTIAGYLLGKAQARKETDEGLAKPGSGEQDV